MRAAKVRIRAQDENGKWFEMDGEELLARAFQHEIDHLDGMLFIFRMSALKRSLSLRKIRKMQREGDVVEPSVEILRLVSAALRSLPCPRSRH